MTFEKYKQGREKFNDSIFPIDGYEYNYIFDNKIGWHFVRGKKLPEFIEGSTWENDFDIDKKQKTFIYGTKELQEYLDNLTVKEPKKYYRLKIRKA